jgi:hypothetical protein
MTFGAIDEDEAATFVNEDVIDVVAHAAPNEIEYENGKCVLKGKCRFGIVYKNGELEEDAEVLSLEKEFPFRYEFADGPEGKEADRFECRVLAIDPKIRVENGRIKFDCEIAVAYKMIEENAISNVTSVRLGEAYSKKKNGFTVCYPDRTDDIWSIAKKHKTVAADVALENGIDESAELDTVCMPENRKYIIL